MSIIGVDNGNANTKTAKFIFPSGIKSFEIKPSVLNEGLLYNGKYYITTSERAPYRRDKTENETALVLTVFAVIKEMQDRGLGNEDKNLILAVGLPPGHYGVNKDRFRQYFMDGFKDLKVTYYSEDSAGEDYYFDIADCLVYSQGHAGLLANSEVYDSVKEYDGVYVIDIGGYTTDIIKIVGGKKEGVTSLNLGMIPMINGSDGIIEKIDSNFGIELQEYQVRTVLEGGKTTLPDDIKNLIITETQKYADFMIQTLLEKKVDINITPAIFEGGGANLLRPYFENNPKVRLPKFIYDVRSNARGYEILSYRKKLAR